MKRCAGCGGLFQADELLGPYCGRCDKIAGDVTAGLKAELEAR